MKYLLDVNTVLAALLPVHADRARFVAWASRLQPADFATFDPGIDDESAELIA